MSIARILFSIILAPISLLFLILIFAITAPSYDGDTVQKQHNKIEYAINEDGESYSLVKVDKSVTELEIPAEVNGKPVTRIAARAFVYSVNGGCSGWHAFGVNLEKLVIPASVTVIEEYAFLDRENFKDDYYKDTGGIITNLYYEGTLADWCTMQIGATPFCRDTNFYIGEELITELTLNENTPVIAANAFKNLATLESADLIYGVEKIGGNAFENTGISILHLPDSVTEIGEGAFKKCASLTEAHMGAGIAALPDSCFENCGSLLVAECAVGLKEMGLNVFYGCNSLLDVDLSEWVLQTIPSRAFAYCESLTSIVIPKTVIQIDDNAFAGCIKLLEIFNLSELELTSGSENYGMVAKYAYAIHNSLEEASSVFEDSEGFVFFTDKEAPQLVSYRGAGGDICLPENFNGNAYQIRFSAFSANQQITSVVIPQKVTSVGNSAFSGCGKLKTVEIYGANYIGNSAFANTAVEKVVLNEGLEKIGGRAFSGCENLSEIVLPQSLKSLGEYAFNESGLTEIELPEKISKVEYGTFYECKNLKRVVLKGVKEIVKYTFCYAPIESITFNEGLTKIGYSAFFNCNSFKQLHLPASLIEIEDNFRGNPDLEIITVAEGNPVWYSVDNCLIERESKTLVIGCTNSVIPADGSVVTIGERAFYSNKIKSLVIPSNITAVGNSAFAGCKNLTEINLPDTLSEIGEYAFSGSGLKNVTIAEGFTHLSDSIFSSCKSLESITLPSTLTFIDGRAFGSSGLKSIVIPKNVTKIGWAAFADTPLKSAQFESGGGWYVDDYSSVKEVLPTFAGTNAKMLSQTYCYANWTKK